MKPVNGNTGFVPPWLGGRQLPPKPAGTLRKAEHEAKANWTLQGSDAPSRFVSRGTFNPVSLLRRPPSSAPGERAPRGQGHVRKPREAVGVADSETAMGGLNVRRQRYGYGCGIA